MSIQSGISPHIREYLKQKKLYVMRDKRTNRPLNVSYTEDGLRYTQNSSGRWIYFQGAWADRTNSDKITFRGNLKRNREVYIELYEPRDHKDSKSKMFEFTFMGKAYRLLYNTISILE